MIVDQVQTKMCNEENRMTEEKTMTTYNPCGHYPLNDCTVGMSFYGYYLMRDVRGFTTRDGNRCLRGVISDASGSMPFVFFENKEDIAEAKEFTTVYLVGRITEYNGAKQATLSRIRLTGPQYGDAYNLYDLYPMARYSGRYGMGIAMRLINLWIKDEEYLAVCQFMLNAYQESWLSCPASFASHHAIVGGLLTHSIEVLYQAATLAQKYNKCYHYDIDIGLLATACLLHDIGKIHCFEEDDNGVMIRPVADASMENHAFVGAMMVRDLASSMGMGKEKQDRLVNLIISHHSSKYFGTGVEPAYREAAILSMIDNLDCHIDVSFGGNPSLRTGKRGQIGSHGAA